jgi:hypothetical protein
VLFTFFRRGHSLSFCGRHMAHRQYVLRFHCGTLSKDNFHSKEPFVSGRYYPPATIRHSVNVGVTVSGGIGQEGNWMAGRGKLADVDYIWLPW